MIADHTPARSDLTRRHREYHDELDDAVSYINDSSKDSSGSIPLEDGMTYTSRLLSFFFGFLMEEEQQEVDLLYRSSLDDNIPLWSNSLYLILFFELSLSSIACSVPVALVTSVSTYLKDDTTLPARVATAAVLGSSLGKFILGPLGDVIGARRTLIISSFSIALFLVCLSLANNATIVLVAYFFVEFFAAVQWPCVLILLATHTRGCKGGVYEGGVYVTSLGSRLGSLLGIPIAAYGLRNNLPWHVVSLVGAWSATMATSVSYLYINDSPANRNDPQNPVDRLLIHKWFPSFATGQAPLTCNILLRLLPVAIRQNIIPSIKHVLGSSLFWIVALAHTGATAVRTSDRLIGSYLSSTSVRDQVTASSLSVFLSLGIVLGLGIAGSLFAGMAERSRKYFVSRLYVAVIASCYLLAFLSIPLVRSILASMDLLIIFQIMAIITAGFGIAVPCYHIPSLVSTTFGCDKGLYAAYIDGVASGLSAVLWHVVGSQIDSPYGWAFGWSAVALLVIISAFVMVEFMEFYFCRPRRGGIYETMIIV